jgi:hypothetical protein
MQVAGQNGRGRAMSVRMYFSKERSRGVGEIDEVGVAERPSRAMNVRMYLTEERNRAAL